MAIKIQPGELVQYDYRPPRRGWMDEPAPFRPGTYSHAGVKKHVEYLGLPNPREWQPYEQDWKLPENWKEIIVGGMRERLGRFRSLKLFRHMRRRVRRQVPFFRARATEEHARAAAEPSARVPALLHPVGKAFRKLAGARDLTEDVLKEWFYYFYQCTECAAARSTPYGIDTRPRSPGWAASS